VLQELPTKDLLEVMPHLQGQIIFQEVVGVLVKLEIQMAMDLVVMV
jgi:hypothetical protein